MDFAPNWSPRYVFRYKHAGAVHRLGVRRARGATRDDEGVVTKIKAVLTTLEGAMYQDWTVLSGAYIPQDEFTSVPVDGSLLNSIEPANAVGGIYPALKAIQWRFECRGSQGGRTAFVLFGLGSANFSGSDVKNDFRVTSAEDTSVAAAVNALSELAPEFVPLGSVTSVWYPYVNIKANDYWVGQLRNGG